MYASTPGLFGSIVSIYYWSDVLRTWVGEPQKMVVRLDPRDLRRFLLLAPDDHYNDLAYRDLRRRPIARHLSIKWHTSSAIA